MHPKKVDIEFKDAKGNLIKEMQYKIKLPDGTSENGNTDTEGLFSIDPEIEGDIEIRIQVKKEEEKESEAD